MSPVERLVKRELRKVFFAAVCVSRDPLSLDTCVCFAATTSGLQMQPAPTSSIEFISIMFAKLGGP